MRGKIAIGFFSFFMAARAWAQPYCPSPAPKCDVAGPNPIYINSADTQVPSLHKIGKKLAAQVDSGGAPNATTLIYVSTGSCPNIQNIYTPKFAGTPFFIPNDPTFDVNAKTACPCVLPSPAPKPDLSISIVVPDNVSCPSGVPASPPPGVGIFKGAVQGMTFVVPYDSNTNVGSSQKAITAEEAYLVLGLGAENAQVSPWDSSQYVFGRPITKGTQISIGANILVPAARWKILSDMNHSIDQSTTMAMTISGLASDPNAEKVLGILGTEIYDQNRGKIHALAFRAFHQEHAYWPDSKLATFDKKNLRDGHYVLWSYVQYLAPVTGGVAKTAVQELIDALTNNLASISYNPGTGVTSADPLDDVIASGLVPECAMKVQRPGGEGSDISPYSSTEPCGCYFDFKATGATTCAACDTNTQPCSGGLVCRRGYCEAR